MSKKKNKTEKAKQADTNPVNGTTEETTVVQEAAENVDETTLLKESLEQEKDRYLRLFAEFENYKKRTTRERVELFKTAGQEVITAMLPVLDDFDRAVSELNKKEDKTEFEGVFLINQKIRETLKSKGLVEMEVAQGAAFDADKHEAITQIPAPSDDLKGKIIDVVEKGYCLGDKVIRFPKVVIGEV